MYFSFLSMLKFNFFCFALLSKMMMLKWSTIFGNNVKPRQTLSLPQVWHCKKCLPLTLNKATERQFENEKQSLILLTLLTVLLVGVNLLYTDNLNLFSNRDLPVYKFITKLKNRIGTTAGFESRLIHQLDGKSEPCQINVHS